MFYFSKIIGAAFKPMGLVLVVLFFSALYSRRKIRALLLTCAAFLYLLSINPVANYLLLPLENYRVPIKAVAPELIVVPGGGSRTISDKNGNTVGRLSAESRSRLMEALLLSRETGLPVLFCGGSPGREHMTEAEAAERLMRRGGLSEKMILLEDKSRTTRENARYAAELTEKRNIILVTSAFHMKRASSSFRREGFELSGHASVAPRHEEGSLLFTDFLPSLTALGNSTLALHEYGGLLWYRICDRF